MSRYSVGRSIAKQIIKEDKKRRTHIRILEEAETRPESVRVETPIGEFYMSPIEFELYEAMRKEGLSPTPQFRIEWYTVDFAFPDVKVAIEADGAAFHSGDRRQHDRERDLKLRRAGWTVKRFHGTTIHQRAANCAYVIKREVEEHRERERMRAMRVETARRERRAAILRPFKKVARLLRRNG